MWVKSNNPFLAIPIPKGIIEQAILNSNSMSSACEQVNCSYNTFRKYAKRYGLWKPNQSGKGISKNKPYKPLYDNVDVDSIKNIRNIFGVNNDAQI